jgi:pimeloyl-ACP methyl ester carboxylesterase
MKSVLRLAVAVFLLLIVFCAVFYEAPLWVADQQIRLNLWRQGVRGGYIEADGYRVHYFEAKPSSGGLGTPLLLIHGLGSRGEDWGSLVPQLAASGFHVYVPDLLGYGRSSRPDVDYSIATEEKLVVAFMQAAGIQKADVGGWSMGGWVAAKLAIDHPELVDRLVLYDSAGIYFPATFDASLFTPHDKAGLDHLTAMLEPHPQKLPAFVAHAVVAKLQANAWVVDRSVAQMVNGRDLLDFRLSRIQRPTLLVWGSKDVLIPLEVGESMHHLIPGSSMTVIEGCGHLAPGQCWHSALAATVQFLKAEPPMNNMEQTLPGN